MSIKQAIEALERASEALPAIGKVHEQIVAALAALRSMPAEPVATLWVQMETHDMGQSLAPNPPFRVAIAKAHINAKDLPLGEYPLFATPHTAPLSDAEIFEIERHGEFWVDGTPLQFARAIEQAIGRASRGVK